MRTLVMPSLNNPLYTSFFSHYQTQTELIIELPSAAENVFQSLSLPFASSQINSENSFGFSVMRGINYQKFLRVPAFQRYMQHFS